MRLLAIYGYHMSESTKTTVYLDSADYRQLKAIARAKGKSAAELVREAVAQYAHRHHGAPTPASIGVGRSGRRDLSERAEDLLAGIGEAQASKAPRRRKRRKA